MDKLTFKAFEKLEKREHLLRVTRDRFALGRITREEFKKEEAAIIEKYELTHEEQRAYEQHIRRKARKKS